MADPYSRVFLPEHDPAWCKGESETMVSLRTTLAPESEPAASVSSELPMPLLADRYELLGLLGVGGMGSIYRVRDRELDEVVALKMLRKDLVSAPEILERFRREVKLARRVTHRNVARVYDIGEHEGDKFLTMELVDGESLGALVAREGALPFARVVEIVSGICAGLTCAHAAGVVHRDLKPDNVLIASDGRVVLTDFGIARAFTETGSGSTLGLVVGTPAYMAPEQVEGRQDVDAVADVYALGVVLYELLTGQRAWPGGAPLAVATARLVADPPDPRRVCPSIPPAVGALVLKCMARRREDRFPSIEAFVTALDAITWPARSVPPPVSRKVPIAASRAISDSADMTVAVLSFRNAGPVEDAYLAEELTDDLIDSLSMTRGLRVRSRVGVLGQQGATREAREIGRELGVQVIVEGSVRRARGNVRISVRLISVADGFQLWARRFARPEQDVLSINDDAAQAIAEALTLDRDAAAREAPGSPEAVDLYLRARHEYRKFWQDNQEQALALFAQAEALAPGHPMILSGKALALARLAFFTGRGLEEAFTAAKQAVEVAPDLGEAHLALGSALLQKGEWKLSVRELCSAVVRAPGLSDAHSAVGRVLLEIGDVDEAIRRLETAIALDPRAPLASATLARCHGLRRDWDRVEEALASTARSNGDITYWTIRARMLLWKRDGAAAELALAQLLACSANVPMARLLYEVGAFRRLPAALSDRPQATSEPPGNVRRRMFLTQIDAEILAYLGGDLEPVISRVAQMIDVGFLDIGWIDGCPLLDEIRSDPRFPPLRAVVKQRADEILEAYRAG